MTKKLLDQMNDVTKQTVAEIGTAVEAAVSRPSNTLLPCPFCGSPARGPHFHEHDRTPGGYWWVECAGLGECCTVEMSEGKEAAVARWNQRHSHEPLPGTAKEHARDVHHQLIEGFGLRDTPLANYAVRQMLETLASRAASPPRLVPTLDEFVEALMSAGWRAPYDAQHNGAAKIHGELFGATATKESAP
jgi:hypothetical protein